MFIQLLDSCRPKLALPRFQQHFLPQGLCPNLSEEISTAETCVCPRRQPFLLAYAIAAIASDAAESTALHGQAWLHSERHKVEALIDTDMKTLLQGSSMFSFATTFHDTMLRYVYMRRALRGHTSVDEVSFPNNSDTSNVLPTFPNTFDISNTFQHFQQFQYFQTFSTLFSTSNNFNTCNTSKHFQQCQYFQTLQHFQHFQQFQCFQTIPSLFNTSQHFQTPISPWSYACPVRCATDSSNTRQLQMVACLFVKGCSILNSKQKQT